MKKKQLLQTKVSNTKKDLERHQVKSNEKTWPLEQAIRDLVHHPEVAGPDQERVVRLKDKFGNFTSEARVCIMTLVGECEVIWECHSDCCAQHSPGQSPAW